MVDVADGPVAKDHYVAFQHEISAMDRLKFLYVLAENGFVSVVNDQDQYVVSPEFANHGVVQIAIGVEPYMPLFEDDSTGNFNGAAAAGDRQFKVTFTTADKRTLLCFMIKGFDRPDSEIELYKPQLELSWLFYRNRVRCLGLFVDYVAFDPEVSDAAKPRLQEMLTEYGLATHTPVGPVRPEDWAGAGVVQIKVGANPQNPGDLAVTLIGIANQPIVSLVLPGADAAVNIKDDKIKGGKIEWRAVEFEQRLRIQILLAQGVGARNALYSNGSIPQPGGFPLGVRVY
jgi:hypothetical protein